MARNQESDTQSVFDVEPEGDILTFVPVKEIETKVGAGSFREAVARIVPWALFLGSAVLLLRPVLLTAITADDLINPFSQTYHAGTGLDPIIRRTWHFVSLTGHFNYLGQSVGSMTLLVWSYLIGNFDIRYSFVYSTTKYVVYVVCILVASALVRSILHRAGLDSSKWHVRGAVLVTTAGLLQIHVPWSNDPVASYPLAGYLTAAAGFGFLVLVLKTLATDSVTWAIVCGLWGAAAVLYYEFNSFAVLSSAPLLIVFLLDKRAKEVRLRSSLKIPILVVGPAAITTVFFYLRNRAASAAYSGTSISLDDPFLATFGKGLVNSLPASSLPLASDWLAEPLRYHFEVQRNFLLGCILLGLLFWTNRRTPWRSNVRGNLRKRWLTAGALALIIYSVGATFSQTSTEKVQTEAVRVGQVYNYYAISATSVGLLIVIGVWTFNWNRIHRSLRLILVAVSLLFIGFQYNLNANILYKFNGMMTASRDLLVAYAEQPSMERRCEALDRWKALGWPEYYWLDMELGLNASSVIYRREEFCTR
jgi:hypothetical protein